MSKICQITGKRVVTGNKVSHSNIKTRRTFEPNLFNKRFYDSESGKWITLKVSAKGIRYINKKGLQVCIKEAKAKGYM